MAAIRAAELECDVTLIEKNPILGKKLLLSGKGRCNLTNACGLEEFLPRFSDKGQFLRDAFDQESLALERLHGEHIVNLIEGTQGPHYGDLDGDGRADNPGDGFGVLPNGPQSGYIQGMIDHAGFAAQSPDATDRIKRYAANVAICGENTRARVTEIRDRALKIFQARSAADPREDVLRILALAEQTTQGVDVNGAGQILPIPGGGGDSWLRG